MKGKKFYIILIGLIIVGIGSVFVHKQQQEARFLEFEGYEISDIENRVAALYNEERTDLADDFSEEELEELEIMLSDLQDKDLGRQNTTRIESMQSELVDADGMFTLEENIMALFVKDEIIEKETSGNAVEELEQEVTDYEEKTVYYDRNHSRLNEAKQQINMIEKATDFIEGLFDEEDLVLEDVKREDEVEALEFVEQIKNEEVREELATRVETVRVALDEREEALALEEAEEAKESEEDEEELETVENTDEFETELEEADEITELEEPEYKVPTNTGRSTSNSAGTGSLSSSNNSTNESSTYESGSSGNSGSTPPSDSDNRWDDGNPGNTSPVVNSYTETENTVIPYETSVREDDGIAVGTEYTISPGSNGLRQITYEVTVYQGGKIEHQMVSEEITEPVSNEIIIKGTRESSPEQDE